MDSRAFTRVATQHEALVTDERYIVHHGQLRDVSLQGVFIGGVTLAQGSVVTVVIELSPDARISAQGRVVRSTPEGVGIVLELLDSSDSSEHLRRLILLNTRSEPQTKQVVGELESHIGLKAVPPPA